MVAQPGRANSGNHFIVNYDQFRAFRDDYRTKKIETNLEVNRHSKFRLIIPNKCKTQGEIELRELAATGMFEESYVYVPSLCLWIEVGYNETRSGVNLDSTLITRLTEDFDQLVIYHIHVGVPLQISGYFPAYRDLVSLILMNAKFFRQPQTQISHQVVIESGVIEYLFRLSQSTNHLINKFTQTGLEHVVAQNLAYFYARDKYKKRYYAKVHECEHLVDGDQKSLSDCFPMKSDDFRLIYRKLKLSNTTGVDE